MMETPSLFVLDILVFLDDVVGLVDAELASFGEVGNGMGRVVKEEVKDATIEVGFCKMIVLFDDAGEARDGIVDVACLCFLEGVFEGVNEVSHACLTEDIVGVFVGKHEFGFLLLILYSASIFAFVFGFLLTSVFFDELLVVVEVDLRLLASLVLLA